MIKLSPSSLSVFKDCPRCFWLDKNQGIKQPRGIFPSLPGGMDRALKVWYDTHRMGKQLPPEIRHLKGSLYTDLPSLEEWRNWRQGMSCKISDDITLCGAVDDAFVEPDGSFSPLDYKTRGSAPKADAPDYYGHQLNIYALFFQENGFKVSGKAYLAYYWQSSVLGHETFDGGVTNTIFGFNCQIEKKEADPEAAIDLALRAGACLKEEIPEHAPSCEYCGYFKDLTGYSQ